MYTCICNQHILFFREVRGNRPLPAITHKSSTRKESQYLCASCGHPVTTREYEETVDGAHIHRFVNPAGIPFTIGCFSNAPGCTHQGPPTDQYTWFPGYSWSCALCGNCSEHLGWRYENSAAIFYGLIMTQLTLPGGQE
jgi:hypothetical protein